MLPAESFTANGHLFKLDAMPDPADFRDQLFTPSLIEAPLSIELDAYRKVGVPVLNQGNEGSCTGFALATVAHYLLRTRTGAPSTDRVSPRMFYEMAKRYDEIEGEEYDGASARGAMKGWHKHGVCADELWTYEAGQQDRVLSAARAEDALRRPLGAYQRVNPRSLTDMHGALASVGVLFATAIVHDGWQTPDADGKISYRGGHLQGHAFAIVGYNREGFWLQNSWGTGWGKNGFALLTYDDWLLNALDVWVARLGAPIIVSRPDAQARLNLPPAFSFNALSLRKIHAHVLSVRENGRFDDHGTYATLEGDVNRILEEDFPEVTKGWSSRRLLLFADSGLYSEQRTVERLADIGARLLQRQIYPLGFIWATQLLTVLQTVIQRALSRVAPGHCDHPTEAFMRDRLDAALEFHVRRSGRQMWEEIKQIGVRAAGDEGAAAMLLGQLATFLDRNPDVEVHMVAHSGGSIFLAPLVQRMTAPGGRVIVGGPMDGLRGFGMKLTTCTLWAPAITIDSFRETYLPAIDQGGIGRFALYTLTDEAERRDCCIDIYRKSLLYLISNAMEEIGHIPLRRDYGQPLLGMEVGVKGDSELFARFENRNVPMDWVKAPNVRPVDSSWAARSMSHFGFDDDVTLNSTIMRIQGA